MTNRKRKRKTYTNNSLSCGAIFSYHNQKMNEVTKDNMCHCFMHCQSLWIQNFAIQLLLDINIIIDREWGPHLDFSLSMDIDESYVSS